MDLTTNVIERAFQLAEKCRSVEEIRAKLKQEGFLNVDAHFSGGQIKSHLAKAIRRDA